MADTRNVWTALAGVLMTLGGGALISRATGWNDPILWIGAVGMLAGALIFMWLLVPPWLTNRQLQRERREQALREGRANQRQGLDEISGELGQISSQLKSELRWGKRSGSLFPTTAWTKNRHLVTGEARTLVQTAYDRAHLLDQKTLAAGQTELDETETQEHQDAKQAVDAAAEAVRDLRNEVEP